MAPKPRGHRQRGAGTVTVSRGEQLRQGVMCKEWQRTPVQLLHEFCQAKKRANPVYHRVRAAAGDKVRVRCVLPDDKNSAKDLAFCPEQSFDSMDEAKHCAALLALKHVEPLRPHERKLPDPYRDLWLSLAGPDDAGKASASSAAPTTKSNASGKGKKKDAKANGAAAPAAAAQPTTTVKKEEATATNSNDMDLWASAGADEEDEGASKKAKKPLPLELSSDRKFASQAEFDQARREKVEERNRRQRSRENRERANIPKSVMMSAACREQIEQVLRDLGSITVPGDGSNSGDVNIADSINLSATSSAIDMDQTLKELRAVGFQDKHCADALRICQPDATTVTTADYVTKALDWLCLNIPEAELPKQFNPEGTQLDVVLASRDVMPSGSSAVLVQRLMKFGYSRADATHVSNEFIREYGDSVIAEDSPMLDVIQKLLYKLSPEIHKHFEVDDVQASDAVPNEEEILAMRQDEIFALEAIYEDKLFVQQIGVDDHPSQLVQLEATDGVKLHIFLPAESKYPFELPLVAVTSPSQDHQSYLLGVTGHALQSCKMSLGEPMLYDLYVAVDSLLQDKSALQNQPNSQQIQLFAPISTQKVSPPPAPADVSKSKSNSQRQGKSKSRQQGRRSTPRMVDKEAVRRLSDMLLTRRQEKESSKAFQQMIKSRASLPAHKEKENVLECVRNNQVTLVCGQTGCGKTTQVPQFILDEYIERGAGGECQIICTQPRRIAAIGVATRVAQERCEQIADVVGYQIRMDAKKSANTRLLFCTTGVLLRRLLTDRALAGVTHVIVDEVHERNIDTDFLLSVLRDLLPHRPELRVILMSATMNSKLFVKYFSTPSKPPCPVLDIPGFTFPVECHFLEDIVEITSYDIPKKLLTKKSKPAADEQSEEPKGKPNPAELVARMDDSRIDYDLCVHLVNYLLTSATPRHDGAILIFLPGTAEIKRLMEMLNQSSSISSRIWVLALHGSLSGADQALVFKSPPSGKTKIIVSTNIAETSITINDITAVIDCGKVKEMVYDNQQRRSQLLDCWASRAACDQRKGRAGRVQSGTCYRLFSRKRFQSMDAQLAAEIHRVSLEQLCLQIKKLELGSIRGFLAKAIEPPKEEAVSAAMQELVEIAAFQHIEDAEEDAKKSRKGKTTRSDDEEVILTPLGSHLAMLPLDARIGKFLVYGSILRCIEPVAIIAACISSKNPFVMSMSDPELREKQEAFKKGLGAQNWKSDHLLLWKVVETYAASARGQKLKRAFCRDNGLSYDTLETILDLKAQYLQQLDAIGFYEAANVDYLNENSSAPRIIKAALCAGLYANVARVLYPEQKYFQSAHGAFTEAHDAKKIRYFIRSRQESEETEVAIPSPAPRDERVFLHPSSSNFSQTEYDSPWLLFTELVQTSKLFVRESTMVNPYALLLFGGRIDVVHDRGLLRIDNWISFHAVARIGVLIKAVRQHLDRLLRAKIEDPGVDIARSELVTAISHLLKSEGM